MRNILIKIRKIRLILVPILIVPNKHKSVKNVF